MHKAGETFNFELIFMAAMSRNTRYWLSQLCGWGLFALINIFFAYSFDKLGSSQERSDFYLRLVIFVTTGFILSHLMRYIIIFYLEPDLFHVSFYYQEPEAAIGYIEAVSIGKRTGIKNYQSTYQPTFYF